MTNTEYFYFEWLIIEKKITSEEYSKLTAKEINSLIEEYGEFLKSI